MKELSFSLLIMLISSLSLFGQDDPVETQVQALLSQMTLEEKIGQMNQYTGFFDATGPTPTDSNTKAKYEDVKAGLVGSMLNVRGAADVRAMQKLAVENSRLGIPMIFAYDVIHGYETISPIPLAETASWDLQAIEYSARIAAIEAGAAGLNWTFAPMLDISRDARWGRVMEGAGEDPYLGSLVGYARVRGFQGEDLSDPYTIAACAKHFAAYGFAESGKDYNTADLGLSTLYNVVFPPFRAALDADVRTFMNSFNELNGIPATGDQVLQREILKGAWEFDGFIVSDWGSIGEMRDHGFARDGVHAAEIAAIAGSDMDMESHLYIKHLKDLVESGAVDIALIDDAVSRILHVKFELGLFEDPYRYCDEEKEALLIGHEDHLAGCLDIAKKSIVLLKNEGDLLPLKKEGSNIAIIGALANDKTSPLGNWRLAGEDGTAISVLEGIENLTGEELSFAKGPELYSGENAFHRHVNINETDWSGKEEAIALAKESEVVVLVMGEHGFQSGEGRSRSDIDLPGLQQEFLEAIYEVNQNIVLVLMNGRPLAIPWADEHIPAILETWQLGTQSGQAIAEVLYGEYNPSGKLPMSFPRNVGQVPIYYNHKSTGRPGPKAEVFWSHYADQTNDPLYPFGYGLSYTSFEYSNLKARQVPNEPTIEVSVKLENTGTVTGEEVVQLYIRDHIASVTRPVKELKGFEKIELTAGTSQIIRFKLTEKELGFYNNQGKFVVEPGKFSIMIGGNSKDLLETSLDLSWE